MMPTSVAANLSTPGLSFAQERMWFLEQLQPEAGSNNCSTTIELTGVLNVSHLQQCMNEIIRRHEALRTRFALHDGHLVQIIEPAMHILVGLVDLSTADISEEAMRQLVLEETRRVFALDQLPLMRLTLFRRKPLLHILQLTTHHIVWDAWSVGVFLRELFELYESYLLGRPSRLQPLRAQYRDFARVEREAIDSPKMQADRAFWRDLLVDLPSLTVPTNYPRPPVQTFHGAVQTSEWSEDLTESIEAFCAKRSVSPFMFVLAALQLYLSFLSGEKRIAVGVPVANRTRREWEGLIGYFINVLVFRTDLHDSESFDDLLHRVRDGALSTYEHGEYPFAKLVEDLNPERSSGLSPLFQVMLVYLNAPLPKLELPSLVGTLWNVESITAKQDLTLTIGIQDARFLAAWEYNSALFRPETIERISCQFTRLVEALITECPLSPALLVTAEEESRIQAWNTTGNPEWLGSTLSELVALDQPDDRVAVVCGEHQLSYGTLRNQVAGWSARLKGLGVGPETPVGILMDRSADLLVAMLAVVAAGGTYVPIDERWPVGRIEDVVRAAGVELLLIDASTRALAVGLPLQTLEMGGERFDESTLDWNRSDVAQSNCGYTIFTSGSTGQPKGIQIPREAVWNLLKSMARKLNFTSEDVFLAVTTVSFDIAVLEWALPLMTGSRVVMVPCEKIRDPRELAQELVRHLPTCMQATPSLWRMLVESDWLGVPGLKILAGGEALPEDLALRLRTKCRELWNLYGPTETTIWSMAGQIDSSAPDLGGPVGNTKIHLLSRKLDRLPLGFEGEIFIAGAGLARAYLNQPSLTADRFVPDPFASVTGARMFRTGDIARWDGDGRLRFIGRADHQLKVRGNRVEAEEIESCLRLHDAIREAVVCLVGEGPDARLVAYLTLRPGTPAARHDHLFGSIAHFLANRLPLPMVPAQFVILDELPLTTSGKIDRKRLPAPLQPPEPAHDAHELSLLSPIEQEVYEAWKTSLGRQGIRVSDNFFDLGGNSLLAAQVCTMLTRVWGVHIPVRLLFESPVFEQFSARVRDERPAGAAEAWPEVEVDPERRYEPFPLTDVQEAYLLGRSSMFELGDVSTHSYFEIDTTRIDVDRFEIAWRKLIQRHDMLRAVFMSDGTQRVLPTVPDYTLRRVDATMATDAERERLLLDIRQEMSHAVHPADRWPLFEIRATRINAEMTRFHFSIDALIGDAFSSALLFRDWCTLYLDPEAALPEIGIQFRDYVSTLRALEDTEMFRRSERYWVERLDESFRGPELPIVEAGRRNANRFSRRSLSLPRETWQAIRTRALNRGLSPTTAVLVAFSEVLAYWSRTQHFVVNLTLFNRLPLHPDVNRIVGDFTSIMLLEVDAAKPGTFEEFAGQMQQRLWSDLDHRLFSGVRVLREMRRRFGTGQEILAPVVFTSTLGMTSDQEPATEKWGDEVYSISQTPQVWLDHKVFEDQGTLGVDWDFAEGLFPDGVIDSMFDAYRNLLTALAKEEMTWSMSRRELHERFFPCSRRPSESVTFEGADTLHGLFLEQARRNPERIAVIAPDRNLTYGELDDWSSWYAARLMEWQIATEEVIPVVAPKGWEQAVAVLGILRAGGAYLPIDSAEPEDRRFRMMQGAGARFALTTPACAESLRWPEHCRPIPVLPRENTGSCPDVTVLGKQLAYVIYTSGSTGQPKGVMIEHRAAVNTLRDLVKRLNLGPADRTLALSALSFDLSVFDCFGIWAAGGAVVYPDSAKAKDPLHWAALLDSERVTIWNTVPALMELLVETTSTRETPLRWILLSGDWIPVSLPPRVAQRWSNARQLSLGGATEASIWSILFPLDRIDPSWIRIPYGQAMSNQSIVVTHQSLEHTPTWVVGEICIGGVGLARGYLGSPTLTKERFLTHPTSGDRLYRTGDLGRYLPDGNIEILGRMDHQVKVNGYRIEIAEIEAVLDSQPGIQQAIVNLESDAAGRKELVSYLVERPQATALGTSPDSTAASLSSKLAQRAIRTFPGDIKTISLQDDLTPRDRERIMARQSYRFFTDSPASLKSMNEWLSAVEQRLCLPHPRGSETSRSRGWFERMVSRLRQTSVDGNLFPKYRYPSAGHLYPVQSYFSVPEDSIPEIEGGHYYYDPRAHRLVRVSDCSDNNGSPLRLILVGELDAIEDEYHEASMRFCALEAGYMSALFLDTRLTATSASKGLRLSNSQRVMAAYEFDAGPPVFTHKIPPLLLWIGQGGLHGAEPGFYVRQPGQGLIRQFGRTAVDPAWFGPNRELFERSHFAVVTAASPETTESFIATGMLGQILMDEAPAFNLGLCPIGEISNQFVEAAGMNGAIFHGWVGGQIEPVQASNWMTAPPQLHREALRQRCRERVTRQLPAYMHPVRYVFLDKVPLTANHKVDRAMLKRMAQTDDADLAPAPVPAGNAIDSEIEREVAQMLESILKHPLPDLDQSFFDMGASSLIIIQLYGLLNARYPNRLGFQDFFDHPSVREIARLIEGAAAVQPENVVEVIDL